MKCRIRLMKEVIACHKSSVSIEPIFLGIHSCKEFQFPFSSSKSVLIYCVFWFKMLILTPSESWTVATCRLGGVMPGSITAAAPCWSPGMPVLARKIDASNTSTHSMVYHDFTLCCSTGAGLLWHRSLRILHLPQQYYSSAPQVLTMPTSFLIEEH